MPSPSVALILGYVWPEPTSSAAGTRDMAIVRALRDRGWRVVYASGARENDFSAALRAQGIETVPVAANDPAFDAFIAQLRPRLAIFDRFVMEEQFGWRVRDHSPDTARVLDTQDLHCLRRAREAAFRAGAPLARIYRAGPDLELHTEDALREVAAIYRSDLTLVLSSFERELLGARFGVPASLSGLAPFAYPDPPAASPGFAERDGFAMIGNFRHPPNADATVWLHREIWPLIRARLPGARVHLYGAYPPREISALHDPSSGFLIEGPVPDACAALARHRVNLAPLRFGAGIKGKLADGWWSGTPAVTTPIGSEGMESVGKAVRWGGTVAPDAAAIAEAAVALYGSETEWNAAQTAGRQILAERFSFRENDARLVDSIERLCVGLEARRGANFVGKILWQQAHRSTTYFSRWIELKERIAREAARPQS